MSVSDRPDVILLGRSVGRPPDAWDAALERATAAYDELAGRGYDAAAAAAILVAAVQFSRTAALWWLPASIAADAGVVGSLDE